MIREPLTIGNIEEFLHLFHSEPYPENGDFPINCKIFKINGNFSKNIKISKKYRYIFHMVILGGINGKNVHAFTALFPCNEQNHTAEARSSVTQKIMFRKP
jgi:hypothetical protein